MRTALVDQSSPADPASTITFAIGGPSAQKLAQTFTVGLPPLVAFGLPIGCSHENPSAELIVEIQEVDATTGTPNGTVLASESYPVTDLPELVTGANQTLALSVPLALRPGTQIAFVLKNLTGSCGILPGPVGDAYAGGSAFSDSPTGWQPVSLGTGRDDLGFESLRREGI